MPYPNAACDRATTIHEVMSKALSDESLVTGGGTEHFTPTATPASEAADQGGRARVRVSFEQIRSLAVGTGGGIGRARVSALGSRELSARRAGDALQGRVADVRPRLADLTALRLRRSGAATLRLRWVRRCSGPSIPWREGTPPAARDGGCCGCSQTPRTAREAS